MAQHGANGWTLGPVGSGIDGAHPGGNDGGFVGQVSHNTGAYLEGPTSHENPYDNVGYTQNANPYGQQGHGHYPPQNQYSNIGFGVEGQPAFPHDVRTLSATQVAGQSHGGDYQQPSVPFASGQNLGYRQYNPQEIVGHYPEFSQPQQHVGLNEFQRGSWAEQQPQHGPSNPYAQGQQLYENNPSLLRIATASPAQSSAPKPEQSQPPYQVDPAASYQPQSYGRPYQAQQNAGVRHGYPIVHIPGPSSLIPGRANATPTPSSGPAIPTSRTAVWPPQGQAPRLGSASMSSTPTHNTPPRLPAAEIPKPGPKLGAPATAMTSNDGVIAVPRIGNPGEGWKLVRGCPNLFVGATPVRRQVVTNTPGVKPHVAGDNRNGTRLLSLLPDPLPCEILREKVRPMVEELKRVSEAINMTREQLKASSAESEEHKRYTDELKKLESKKTNLESEKKKITGKAGVLKVGNKGRAVSKSEVVLYDSESLTESSEEEDPQELIVQQIMASQKRPTDTKKGVEYDVVKIIRHEFDGDPGLGSQGEKEDHRSRVIGRRVADFGKYVVEICAEAKSLREQKSNAPKGQSSQLQASIDQKYDLVRLALEAALEYGDEETLRNMGQHMKLMSGLAITLSRQLSNKPYNTDVSRTILRFISEATLMDLDVFHKVKLSTVFEKYGDNLDSEGKQLVAQISKHAEERSAKNAAEKPATSSQSRHKSLDIPKEHQAPVTQRTAAPTKSLGTASKLPNYQSATTATPDPIKREIRNYSGLGSARRFGPDKPTPDKPAPDKPTPDKPTPKASPMKRPREEEIDPRGVKKQATESNAGQPGTGRTVPVPSPSPAAALAAVPTNGQPRARPQVSSVLNKSRAAPKVPARKPEPQSTGSSTIGGLLAQIANPAEKPKPQERLVKVVETPEEKARRLRKESRRGRTVMWKPDDELVQVRFFEHDSTEDEGRASNMIRDARDNRLEGQMLKQMQRNMQEGDDEDDDGNPTETDIRPWIAPQAFDYSRLDNPQREKNYVTRGGTREINSDQKKIMEEYENRELMSIYTTLSEIPETPRSPPKNTIDPIVQTIQAGLLANNPKRPEILQRWAESRQFGANSASQAALRRLGISPNNSNAGLTPGRLNTGSNTGPSQLTSGSRMMTQEERDAQVLALLQSDRARHYVDPDPYDPANPKIIQPPETGDETVQKSFLFLKSVVDQYKNAPTKSTASSQGPPAHVHEGYAGYTHDFVAQAKREEEYTRKAAESAQHHYGVPQNSQFAAYQLQAQAQAQTQQQSQTYSQVAHQVPNQYAAILQQVQALQNPQTAQNTAPPQPTPPAQTDNGLAALLATLSHSAQPVQAATQDSNYAAWQNWAQSQAQSYGAQAQNQPQVQSYTPYTQQYDATPRDEATYSSKQDHQSQGQYSADRGNRKEFHRGTKDHKGINRALIGTKPCTFWAKGQCAKGDNCTFRHDPNDLK